MTGTAKIHMTQYIMPNTQVSLPPLTTVRFLTGLILFKI